MKLAVSHGPLESQRCALMAIPVFEGEKLPYQHPDIKSEFKKLSLSYEGYRGCKKLVFVGLGKKAELSVERVRKAFAGVSRLAADLETEALSVLLRPLPDLTPQAAANAVVEGVTLGSYTFDKYKTKKDTHLQQLTVVTEANVLAGMETTARICANVLVARDMINENADVMTSLKIAAFAKEIARKHRLRLRILERRDMERLGMGLLLGVSSGGQWPPKLIVLEYQGDPKSKDRYALIGKGITFDSGGYNLKPTGFLETMKLDMTGAAIVLGVLNTIADLKLKINAVAVAPVCENLIGPKAYKPGDVLTACNGKTVEIENTDAEGRLILGDAIAYAVKALKPTQIITIATLTGAAAVILGDYVTPMIGDGPAKKRLFEAGEATYDRVWELPIYDEFMEELKGDISDIKNLGYNKRFAGTIMGAAFLKSFADKTPLLHLDVGGTAWLDKPRGYLPKNATAAGMRLLIEFFRRQSR